jgi:tetratricopeptide (TPR) repeat protein
MLGRIVRVLLCSPILAATIVVASDRWTAAAEEPGGPGKSAPYATLALTAQEPETPGPNFESRLLIRELLRQAVLLAARDELGLATRDAALRETIPTQPETDTLVLVPDTASRQREFILLRLKRAGDDKQEPLYERKFAWPVASPATPILVISSFLAEVEQQSRNELFEALKTAGCQVKPLAAEPALKVPAEVELQLREMNFCSQFSALRALHALEQSEGRSPRTLGALVRGYANLGQLVAFHWNASHKACFARSLLYAQRLIQSQGETHWSLAHRAYAETLAGLHAAALADLEAAKKIAPADGLAAPVWEPLIEAFCRYDRQAISAATTDDLRELGSVLGFRAVENSGREGLTLTVGKRALGVVPECYSICESMNHFPGVNNRHFTTVQGATILGQTLGKRLDEIPNLPAPLRVELDRLTVNQAQQQFDAAVGAGQPRIETIKLLVEAGATGVDRVEPGLEVLGRMIEDATLVHAYRRIEFFTGGLGLAPATYRDHVRAAEMLVASHPYAIAIRAALLNPRTHAEQIQALYQQMPLVDADMSMYSLLVRAQQGPQPTRAAGAKLVQAAARHFDFIAPDVEAMGAFGFNHQQCGRLLETISPHSPSGAAMRIETEKYTAEQLRPFESQYAEHPGVFRALADAYTRLNQPDDTERCLRRYIELSPDQFGYDRLAGTYLARKEMDKWQRTLEESLKIEDFALSHAKTNVTLARYFMKQQDFEKALPYADAAAASGAQWALICAGECHEALAHWDQAEQMVRVITERYPGQQFEWCLWCARTGHGDAKAADQFAMRHVTPMNNTTNPAYWTRMATFLLLSSKPAAARTMFQKMIDTQGTPWDGIQTALLAADSGDAVVRDALLFKVEQTALKKFPNSKMDKLAAWIKAAFQQETVSDEQLTQLDAILEAAPPGERVAVAYFGARVLRGRGQAERAAKYLQAGMAASNRTITYYTLCAVMLRELMPGADKPAAGDAPTEDASDEK